MPINDKTIAIREMKNTKIVLGNGFDLFCGLKTRYEDYFEYCKGKYDYLVERSEEATQILLQNSHIRNDPHAFVYRFEHIQDINCWDVFFVMISARKKGNLWCDIETEMLDSLLLEDQDVKGEYKPHWENVWQFINKDFSKGHKGGSIILGQFLLEKSQKVFKTRDDFYDYLLEQLQEFEKNFGIFIIKQHITWDSFIYHCNEQYIRTADSLLNEFCKPDQIASIDCFNYGFTPQPKYYKKCRFINGDCSYPIFGVDSIFEPSDPRYIFTKTNRRMEWDMNKSSPPNETDFENVIVFGHSLSQHDYSYFFPVLDKLEMTNFASNRKIVFAYYVFDQSRAVSIRKNIRKNIYSLFVSYANYCGKSIQPTRLLDSLTTQGRVFTYEICWEPHTDGTFLNKVSFWPPNPTRKDISDRWDEYLERGREDFDFD